MQELEIPLFSNTCGKLFADRIVFASANREKEILPQTLSRLTFTGSLTIGSILYMLLFLAIAGGALFINIATVFKLGLFSMSMLLLLWFVLKGKRKYAINIYFKDGSARSIRVWEGNRKDAQKFVEQANRLFLTVSPVAVPDTAGASFVAAVRSLTGKPIASDS